MLCIFLHHFHLEIMYICCEMLLSVIPLTNTCMPDLLYGKRLVASTFKIIEKSSLFSCAAECTSLGMCKSFNFESRQRTCQLNVDNDPQHLQDGGEEDVIYSPIMNWNKTTLGPCQNVTCGYTERCSVKRNGFVQCVDFLPNIAKDKPASASSRWRGDAIPPSAAVDGDVRAYWASRSCFATGYGDFSPWWQVDLQGTYVVVEVRVTSREDCCPERLHDFTVYVYQDDPLVNTTCYMYIGNVTEPGHIVAEQCTARVTGRYVRLTRDQTIDSFDILQFCEVQVFGFKML